jgi:hypothetical protein
MKKAKRQKIQTRIKVWTPLELAIILHVSPRWVYDQLALGTIPSVHIGRKIFVTEETLAKLLTNNINSKSVGKSKESTTNEK